MLDRVESSGFRVWGLFGPLGPLQGLGVEMTFGEETLAWYEQRFFKMSFGRETPKREGRPRSWSGLFGGTCPLTSAAPAPTPPLSDTGDTASIGAGCDEIGAVEPKGAGFRR